jgi:uridine monophosphate synthetase
MARSTPSKEELVLSLFEAECLKFGTFKLKTGIMSPVYFDLRVVVSFPKLMTMVSQFLWAEVENYKERFDSVCGVPYTALPMGTLVSVNCGLPMLMRRQEAKNYGTKKLIEGKIVEGSNCLVVEDVVTSGSSVLETVQALGSVGVRVTDAVVLLNRQQGGLENLEKNNVKLHSVLTISDVLEILSRNGKISSQIVEEVMKFITTTPAAIPTTPQPPGGNVAEMTFEERCSLATHPVAKRLFEIMVAKRSNLCVSVDVTTVNEVLKICDQVGPYVCMVKTHVDIVQDFTADRWMELKLLATKHNFLIMEDRKFADIGNTVKAQFSGGVYTISRWADLVTVHAIAGPGTVQALEESASEGRPFGCVLLAEMSSKGNLINSEYTKGVTSMAAVKTSIVAGFVCVNRVSQDPGVVLMTPGEWAVFTEASIGKLVDHSANVHMCTVRFYIHGAI